MPTTRPRRLTLAATWLAVTGLLAAFYGGILPFLAPLVTTPVPLASAAFGLLGLAAAVGIWRVAAWGRWLGVGIQLFAVVQALGYILWRATTDGRAGSSAVGPESIAGLILNVLTWAIELAVLWVLLRRWPRSRE